MYEIDGNPGPFEVGRMRIDSASYLPAVLRLLIICGESSGWATRSGR